MFPAPHAFVRPLLAAAVLAGPGVGAWAQSATSGPQKGDVIHLEVGLDLVQRNRVEGAAGATATTVCLPRGSSFDIVDGSGGTDGKEILMTRRERWKFTDPQRTNCDGGDIGATPSEDHHLYAIDRDALKAAYYRHRGITHGALFVPFKRRFDKSLSGESNLGYYLGYRFGGPLGVSITPAASVGLSIVNVSDDSQVSASTKRGDTGTRPAFTWTAGFILNHLDAFQIGIFVGRDRIGGDVGRDWKFENRTWSSIAFGYAFGR